MMLSYLLEVSICWGAFYLLYWLLLSRETFFHFNRGYLLATLLAGLVIPAVEWQLPGAQSEIATVYLQPITLGVASIEVTVTATPLAAGVGFFDVLTWLYWAGVVWCTLQVGMGMAQIYRLYRHGERQQQPGFQLVLSQKAHAPFSFFHCLFLSRQVALDPADRVQIVHHELAHIRGKHSLDVLLLEILRAVFWCSPFIYLYRRSLRTVHEYIADAAVLRTTQRKQYGHLLIRQSQSGPAIAIANPFHSQLKKRIFMMMRHQSKREAMLKYLLVIPLTVLVLLVFSNAEAKASLQQQAAQLQQAVQEELDWNNLHTTVEGEHFTKLKVVNGQLQLESKDGITVTTDSIPVLANTKTLHKELIEVEIYHPDGKVEKLAGTAQEVKIEEKVNPEEIEKIDVYQNNGENLIKIWLKGSKQQNMTVLTSGEAPIFVGCEGEKDPQKRLECSQHKMLEHIYKAIKYPKEARENGIQGTVVVEFYINEKGFVSNASISHGIGGGCDEEVLRVVNTMPRWTPRYKKDKPINTFFTLPVNYKLEGDERNGSFLPEGELIDTVTTFDYRTYEEKVEVRDWNKNKITVIGYGTNQNHKPMPNEEVFKTVEQMPEFPGGVNKLMEFLAKNIKYPASAREAGAEGKVAVQFIVSKDGTVRAPKVLRGVREDLDAEALRVIGLMPRWAPGRQKGEVVDVQFVVPIQFKLQEAPKNNAVQSNSNTLALKGFAVAPNPTQSGRLNLSFQGEAKATMIKIFDLQGKELQSIPLPNFDGNFNGQLDLTKMPKGTLLLTIRQGEQVYSERVVVQ